MEPACTIRRPSIWVYEAQPCSHFKAELMTDIKTAYIKEWRKI